MTNREQYLPTYDPSIPETEEVLNALRVGLPVERLSSRNKIYQRTLMIAKDDSGLLYTPSKKSGQQLMLFSDIHSVFLEDPYTKTYRKANLTPEQSTIVNIHSLRNVHWRFVFHDNTFCRAWLNAIAFILEREKVGRSESLDDHIQSLWKKADSNLDGVLSLKEIKKLLINVGVISVNDVSVQQLFDMFDTSCDGQLDFEEFRCLYLHLVDWPELRDIFMMYAVLNPEKGMYLNEFECFLKQQGDPVINAPKYFSNWGISAEDHLSYHVFTTFLLDVTCNSVLDPRSAMVTDDMDQPLTHYYINSSHNTYLVGNQFSSSSSVDMYRDALLSGCRCVEIDCRGGENGTTEVHHRNTLTSKISFEDVIKTINKYAFQCSDFPVVLSLDVRASPEVHRSIATTLRQVLGDRMVMADEVKRIAYTPNGMRGRFLVKWKMLNSNQCNIASEEGSFQGIPSESGEPLADAMLGSCVGMCSWKTTNYGKDAEIYNVQSYSESAISSLDKEECSMMQLQNLRMLSRVYPKGGRFFSSNYDPLVPWSLGCHMVALNFQTWDEHHRLNDGMFLKNGNCGYVLKPSFLTNPGEGERPTPYKLHVRVVGGAWIPRSGQRKAENIIDPYVTIKVKSFTGNCCCRTKTVWNNGLRPVWNESFNLSGACAELDMLSICVSDSNMASDEEICDSNIPVRLIRNGYRAVPMRLCANGHRLLKTTVLCYFQLDY